MRVTAYRIMMVGIHVLDDSQLGCGILCFRSGHCAKMAGSQFRHVFGMVSDVVLIDCCEVCCGVTNEHR